VRFPAKLFDFPGKGKVRALIRTGPVQLLL
jgi:hypothetical protein